MDKQLTQDRRKVRKVTMKKYTQAEFDALPIDENGIKQCPTGDYSQIKEFPDWCSFGEGCRFGVGCSFEGLHNCSFVATDRIGSRSGKTYFFKADEGFYVRCGCFFGTIENFESRVKEVHAGTKHERDYLAAIAFAKVVLDYKKRRKHE